MPINPDTRLKREYGGVKAALEYCTAMGLNKLQTAAMLGIDVRTVRERAKRFGVEFPNGYATRDMTLVKEVQRARVTAANRAGTMGGRVRWGKRT